MINETEILTNELINSKLNNWNEISKQKLSEDFIRELSYKVDWHWMCIYQKLSEDFIKEFSDKVDWYFISKHQKLSMDFIKEFKYELNWHCINTKN